MKFRVNSFLLGAFLVGAVALGVAGFLAIGSTNLWHRSGHFVICLSGPAEGIHEGTAVSLQGIRVGLVDGLRVLYNRAAHKSYVIATCSITYDKLDDMQGHPIHLTDRGVLKRLVADGLFARAQNAGIVGAKYIELGFDSSTKPIAPLDLPESPYLVIPTEPSPMSEMTENVSRILAHVREADIAGVAQQAKEALASAHQEIDDMHSNNLAAHVSSAAAAVASLASAPAWRDTLVRMQGLASNLQSLASNIDTRVPPLATNLNHTLANTSQAARDIQDFLALRDQLGGRTQELMEQINQTARDIQQLADFLDRNPNALLTGRARSKNSPSTP